jgi:hypothetical protein
MIERETDRDSLTPALSQREREKSWLALWAGEGAERVG